jgi:hypothetical protein
MQDLQRQNSETRAIAKYGAAEFEAMEAEVQALLTARDPEVQSLSAAVRSSADPAGVAMRWYMDRKVRKEVGNDPVAYRQKLRDELAKDPEFIKQVLEGQRTQLQANPSSRPVINLPPSVNRATGSAGSNASGGDDDMSDRALFQHAISGRGR